ncbi:MAG: GNAT family N-acetyltransferase [Anaerolineae bacterium]|nr:GNAT family N-acetyltransferase [Anaerolineae bacterium]
MPFDFNNLFVGELVKLAPPQADDAEGFARWHQDAEYLRNVDTDIARLQPLAAFESGGYQPERNSASFRIRTLADDKLIGFIVIHSIEWGNQTGILSMGIGEADYRGKGYGGDALKLILRFAFYELNLYRVGLNVTSYNQRGIRAYEKAGFVREGVIRGQIHRDGQRYDLIWMGILREEWLKISGEKS